MEISAIYKVILSLDQSEKSGFQKFCRQRNTRKTKPNHLELYDRLGKAKSENDPAITKGIFSDSVVVWKAKNKLIDYLIEYLNSKKDSGYEIANLLDTSIEIKAIEYAKKTLEKGLVEAQNKGDFHLQYILISKAIRYKDNYRIDLGLENDSEQLELIKCSLMMQVEARNLISRTKEFYFQSGIQREGVESDIEAFFKNPMLSLIEESFYVSKLRILQNILQGNRIVAAKLHFELVDKILLGLVRGEEINRYRELDKAITFALMAGNSQKANQYLLKYGLLVPKSLIERTEYNLYFTKGRIRLGLAFGNTDMVLNGLEDLVLNSNEYPPDQVAYYIYWGCTALCYQGAIKKGHDYCKLILPGSKFFHDDLKWQCEILDIIFHCEKGNWGFVESIIASKKRKFSHLQYPSLILKGISYISNNFGTVNQFILDRILSQIEEIKQDETAQKQINYFDFALYLNSKISGTTAYLYYAQEEKQIPFKVVV